MAEKSVRQLQVEIDEGRAGVCRERISDTTFREWAADYLGVLADKRRKASTVRAYEGTIAYANDAFGDVLLGEIGNPELRDFARLIRGASGKGSDATASKHLRQLSAILEAAVEDELIPRNPVPKFRKSLGLKVAKGDEAYTDQELEALWATMAKLGRSSACRAAVSSHCPTRTRGRATAQNAESTTVGWRLAPLLRERR